MATWRDELIEAVKTKAEREAEELARHRKRVEEALTTADAAVNLGVEGLRFTRDRLTDKGQPVELTEAQDATSSRCASIPSPSSSRAIARW